jgi:hypothetical protein
MILVTGLMAGRRRKCALISVRSKSSFSPKRPYRIRGPLNLQLRGPGNNFIRIRKASCAGDHWPPSVPWIRMSGPKLQFLHIYHVDRRNVIFLKTFFFFWKIEGKGRVIVQLVSRWPLTAVARVRSQAIACGI